MVMNDKFHVKQPWRVLRYCASMFL